MHWSKRIKVDIVNHSNLSGGTVMLDDRPADSQMYHPGGVKYEVKIGRRWYTLNPITLRKWTHIRVRPNGELLYARNKPQ